MIKKNYLFSLLLLNVNCDVNNNLSQQENSSEEDLKQNVSGGIIIAGIILVCLKMDSKS